MSTPSDKKNISPDPSFASPDEASAAPSPAITPPEAEEDSAVPPYMRARQETGPAHAGSADADADGHEAQASAGEQAAWSEAPKNNNEEPAPFGEDAFEDVFASSFGAAETPEGTPASPVIAVAPDGTAECSETSAAPKTFADTPDSGPDERQPATQHDGAPAESGAPETYFAAEPTPFADFTDKLFMPEDAARKTADASPLADALSPPDPENDAEPQAEPEDGGIRDAAFSAAATEAVTPEPAQGKAARKKTGMFSRKKPDTPRAPAQPRSPRPGFAATHPVLPIDNSMPPGVWSRVYNALAVSPLLVLTLLLVLQTVFTLDARSLWFSDEVRHADAFARLLHEGKGLILELNGQPYPDKPPLYFWFLRGLYALLGTEGPMLHFTAAAVSGLLFLWAALALASQVGRLDRRGRLGFGLMLLSTGYIVGMFHYARMDLLFAALILAAHVLLYRALVSPQKAWLPMLAAFGLAGIATLVKGPLALAFLFCAALPFAMWRGTADRFVCLLTMTWSAAAGALIPLAGLPLLQRAGMLVEATALPLPWGLYLLAAAAVPALAVGLARRDLRRCAALSLLLLGGEFVLLGGLPFVNLDPLIAIPLSAAAFPACLQLTPQRPFRADFYVGLLFGTAVAASWLAAIYLINGNLDFILNSLLQTQVLERAVDTFHHKEPWHYYLIRVPLMLLPWTLLLFFLPWGSIFSHTTREAVAASKTPEKEGLAYLWCMVVSALALLSVLSGKIVLYFLPAAPAALILLTRSALALEGKRAARFRFCLGVFFLIAGILAIFASLMLFGILPFPDFKGVPQWELPISGGFFIVAALLLLTGAFLLQGLSNSRPEGVLLVPALAVAALAYPLAGLVAPALDDVLSPKKQALLMRAYMQRGYTAATHNTYSGIYSFYAGGNIAELPSLDDAAALGDQGRVILALHAKQADRWIGKPDCFEEVHRQWLESREYVLLACPPIADLPPAEVPYAPAPDIFGSVRALLGLPAAEEAPAKPAPDDAPRTAPAEDTPDGKGSVEEQGVPAGSEPLDPAGSAPEDEGAPAPTEPENRPPDEDAVPGDTTAEPDKKSLDEDAVPGDTTAEPEKKSLDEDAVPGDTTADGTEELSPAPAADPALSGDAEETTE